MQQVLVLQESPDFLAIYRQQKCYIVFFYYSTDRLSISGAGAYRLLYHQNLFKKT